MKILGFYLGGHDSNVSFAYDDGSVQYYKLERIIQLKHKKGSIEWVKELCNEKHFEPDIICFSDGNRNNLGICNENELFCKVSPLPELFDKPTFCIDHHYAHILSAWPVMYEQEEIQVSVGICVDGRGDHQIKCSVISNPFNIHNATIVFASKDDAFCLLFNRIGKLMGLQGGELDYAGKIMGAHSYGTANKIYVSQCENYLKHDRIENILALPYQGKKVEEICKNMDDTFFDWLASIHHVVGNEINSIFSLYADSNGKIVYAGGGAQNTVYNEKLSKEYEVIIPPHCYDGGISLGCLKFAALYLGKSLQFCEFPFGQDENNLGFAEKESIEKIAQYLSEGKIIGWCQGKGEIGPRALGHRSILMNPSIANGKDILNLRVKKRESWRPFAASILSEDSCKIMGEERKCKYMLHAVQVDDLYKESLKSVVHIDGTCRFQTVDNSEQLHSFYKLIDKFKKITGVPALMNTSYNLAGMPIADSYDDVLSAFNEMDLDVLCVGNEIILKKEN